MTEKISCDSNQCMSLDGLVSAHMLKESFLWDTLTNEEEPTNPSWMS